MVEIEEGELQDLTENAITDYLIKKKVDKNQLWKLGLNMFELSIHIEEYILNRLTEEKESLFDRQEFKSYAKEGPELELPINITFNSNGTVTEEIGELRFKEEKKDGK